MRISDYTRFPHPVLSNWTNDYVGAEFRASVSIIESRDGDSLCLEYTADIDEPSLRDLIRSAEADLGLFVICEKTYYDRFHILSASGKGTIEFLAGELKGTVRLRPLIAVREHISDFSATSLHEEFRDTSWSFSPSDILAMGDELIVSVGAEKLAPMETIFNLEEDEELQYAETQVILEGDKIAIRANKKTCREIHSMRNTQMGRAALLNGVYLPAVMEVLAALSADSGQYTQFRWYSVFSEKCSHLGITFGGAELLADAQKLLHTPLQEMLLCKEFTPE